MGKLLQVRVSVSTFSEDEVMETWPSLWKLVWGEGGDAIPKKGAMELAAAVFDGVRAGLYDKNLSQALRRGADEADRVRLEIEDALAARNPQKADRLTYDLEDALDELEDILGDF